MNPMENENTNANANRENNEIIIYAPFPKGIDNCELGLCFLNTALQCLLSMDSLRERYAGWPLTSPPTCGQMTYEIAKLFAERNSYDFSTTLEPSEPATNIFKILYGEKPEFNVTTLCGILNFVPNLFKKIFLDYGEASHNAFAAQFEILKCLEEERKQKCLTDLPPIWDDFLGDFKSVVKCLNCGRKYDIPFSFDFSYFNTVAPTILMEFDRDILAMLFEDTYVENGRWLRVNDILPYVEFDYVYRHRCLRCRQQFITDSLTLNAGFEFCIQKPPRVFMLYIPILQAYFADGVFDPNTVPSNFMLFETHLDLSAYAPAHTSSEEFGNYKYKLIAVAEFVDLGTETECHSRVYITGSKYGESDSTWFLVDDHQTFTVPESVVLNNITQHFLVYERCPH